jgi:hypothetical protein
LNSRLRALHWWDFQHGNKPLASVVWAFAMAPGIAAFGLGVSAQVEYFNLAMPNGLAAKHFMDGHRSAVNRSALV